MFISAHVLAALPKGFSFLIVCFLFLVLSLGQPTAYAQESIGSLKQFEGAVELSRKSNALSLDMPMFDEDRIKTEEGSAEVTFKDGSILKVRPQSDMLIKVTKQKRKLLGVWTKEYLARIITIDRGEANAVITPNKDLKTEFESVSAITAVRGTTVTINVNDEGYTIVQPEEGEVECSSLDGWITYTLSTGESMGVFQCPPPESVLLLVCYSGTIEVNVGNCTLVLEGGEQAAVRFDPETGVFAMAAVVGEIAVTCGGETIQVPEGLGSTSSPGEGPSEPAEPVIEPCYFVEPVAPVAAAPPGPTFLAPSAQTPPPRPPQASPAQ